MMKGLMTVLLLKTLVAANMEPINIIGTPHLATTHAIYKALGGLFNLSSSGIEGFENSYISHLIFDRNITSISSISADRSISSSARSPDLVHSKRAPVNYNSFNCVTLGQYGDEAFFTVAQQQFMAGTACNAFASATPAIWEVIGMVISGAACAATTFTGTCNVVVTVATAVAGQYIQPAFQAQCLAAYDAIETNYGTAMGGADITTTADSQEYNIDMYATTEDTSGVCTTDPEIDCFAATCGTDQCLPSTN